MMRKRFLSIVLALCMLLMLVPQAVFAEECQHTDIDEYQVCKNCEMPVCPACHSSNAVVLAIYDPATCEEDGTWFIFCVSSSCPAECAAKNQGIEGTVPALGHNDDNKDHHCDHGCGKSDMGDHIDMDGDCKCDYGCSVPICDHKELDCSRICVACGYPICYECNQPFLTWVINEYPTCESRGQYTAVDDCGIFTIDLLSLGHLDENNDHICDREECGKEGICLHKGTVNAYQSCDYCGEPVCPKCENSRFIELVYTDEGEPVISYHAIEATCEEDGSWEITCLNPSCASAGGTFSGIVPALGHTDENKDHLCDRGCGTTLSEHSGGEATCKEKAVCEYCGEEYGELDSSNHHLEKVPAKDATVTETGNKAYWHCLDCGKYFSDENAENEIELDDTVTQKLPPEIIEGKGQSVTEGEKKEIIFRSNAAFGDFVRVELDGKTLDEKNYTVKEGSTVVTLKADYVATLSAGEHTVGIVSESGTAAAAFTVNVKAANTNHSPKTDDNSHMAVCFALLAVSAAGAGGLYLYGKKRKHCAKS